jgi:hypothetical protein
MLEKLVHRVEEQLCDLGRKLWESDPLVRVEETALRIETELQQQRAALRLAGLQRAAAQKRLKNNQDLVARLPMLVRRSMQADRSQEAWQHALALDRARQEMSEDEAAIPRLGQVCWSLHFQIRQLERRLAEHRRQLAAAPHA